MPDHWSDDDKVVDGARMKWCFPLFLDAMSSFLDKDEFNLSHRRTFNQHKGMLKTFHIPYTIYHISYTIHHTPYTIHHIPYTIYHIPYTIHHTPYTIYHISYTIYHTPYTIYHIPYT
ncbi:hypothetical protein EON63_21390, partial [archaeon]